MDLFPCLRLFGINLTSLYMGLRYFISQLKGVLGVEFFFVISGFLITSILMRKEIHPKNVVHFYQRRFFRIYPAYCLMVMLSIAIYTFQGHDEIGSAFIMALYHLLFLQNYFPLHPFLAHTWTVVVLEQFYFFAPLLILAVNGIVLEENQRRQVFVGIVILFMILACGIRVYCLNTGSSFISWPLHSTTPYWTITSNLGPIGFGSLLALLEPYWSQWKKSKWWGIPLWIMGIVLFCILYFEFDWSYYWGNWYMYVLGYLCVGLLFFAAYHGVSLFAHLKILQRLGRASYGIFVWHFLVLEFWKLLIGTIPPELIVIGAFISCIWVGVLSTNIFERYFLNLREKVVPNI